MWSEFTINEQLEDEVVRCILEKVVMMRERDLQKTTKDLLLSMQPQRDRYRNKTPFEPKRQQQDATSGSVIEEANQTFMSNFGGVTKGKATFKPRG